MPLIPLDALQIDNLPPKEDDMFEYKCSQTSFDALKPKLIKAASAFGNSGGGCFFVGVTNEGVPDGGIEPKVGRQSLEDWADAALKRVTPAVKYTTKLYDTRDVTIGLSPGKVILGVSFAESPLAPHMADDNKYYIRAGAHSLPAGSFIVESLWARRSQSKPMLSHVIREKPGSPTVVQIGVIALNSVPAVDVEFNIVPLVGIFQHLGIYFPMRLPVIDKSTPFFLDCTMHDRFQTDFPDNSILHIDYSSVNGERFSYRSRYPLKSALNPVRIGTDPLDKIANAILGLSRQ